jgi:hypothetical protein
LYFPNFLESLKCFLVILAFFFMGCSSGDPPKDSESFWQEISGRDEGEGKFYRVPVYRAKVFPGWVFHEPDAKESIFDTMKANSEFLIEYPEGTIRIAVHNFPVTNKNDRIPPMAQIARWKRQISEIDQVSLKEDLFAHGGFAGTLIEATGLIDEKKISVIAVAMQLDSEHYQVLSQKSGTEEEQNLYRQQSADYTIKASGPPDIVSKKRKEILKFARSFELIEEIPVRK